jgi:hypothetical protein
MQSSSDQNFTQTQGCQMVCFQTKNLNLGKFWRALDWKMLIYFMAIWNILRTFDIIYSLLSRFVVIWYIFPVLVSRTKKNLATLSSCKTKQFNRGFSFGFKGVRLIWSHFQPMANQKFLLANPVRFFPSIMRRRNFFSTLPATSYKYVRKSRCIWLRKKTIDSKNVERILIFAMRAKQCIKWIARCCRFLLLAWLISSFSVSVLVPSFRLIASIASCAESDTFT